MPMDRYRISPLGEKAVELLEQAIAEVRQGLDALPTISAAEAVLRAEAGELSADDVMELLDPVGECPDGRSSCMVDHSDYLTRRSTDHDGRGTPTHHRA